MPNENIALVGFMAAGKTTVGRALAAELGATFRDTDQVIEEELGRTVPQIFAVEGEEGFRHWEQQVVAELGAGWGQVIACGGGVIRNAENITALRQHGRIVWLRIGVPLAVRRLSRDRHGRPLIDNFVRRHDHASLVARVTQLIAERTPLYEAAADQIVDVDGGSPRQVVRKIIAGAPDAQSN